MSRWWRAYDEALDDPKLLLLPSDRHRWGWFVLMCLASTYGGSLPPIDVMALKLRTSKHKVAELITALVTAGLIDRNGDTFEPHNWKGRQYRSDVTDPTAANRMRNYRNRKRNDTVTVTPPRVREQNTEAEKKERTRASALWPFDAFYRQYPHKVGRQAAEKAFRKAEKTGKTTFENLMLGLMRYAAKTDDRPWCNPATWLNEGRWEDQPAPQLFNGNGAGHGQPSAGDRAREFAQLAREREVEAGFSRPIDIVGSS